MTLHRVQGRTMAPSLLIQELRKSGGNRCKLASHQSLNKIHRDCKIG